MKVLIPRDTLHKEIHHRIHTIPVPDGLDAQRVFGLLVELEAMGKLDMEAGIEERLDFLIEHLSTPETVSALRDEKEIVHQFYAGGA